MIFIRRHWFLLSLLATFAAGVALVVLGDHYTVVTSLGDALIVAVVLAVLVDQYAKQRLLNSLVGRVLVAIPQEPAEFSVAVRNLTALDQHAVQCRWTADFQWEDQENGVLKVVLTTWVSVKNNAVKSYTPTGTSWVLESVHPHHTSFEYWSYEIPAHGVRVRLTKDQIEKGSTRRGHRVFVDCTELAVAQGQNLTCERGELFVLEKQATMFRLSSDFIPLANRWVVVSSELECCGSAVDDLDLDVVCAGQVPKTNHDGQVGGKKTDGRVFVFADPMFCDATILLVWSRRTPETSPAFKRESSPANCDSE